MQKQLHKTCIFIFLILALFSANLFAYPQSLDNKFYIDKAKVLAEQIDILKNRKSQAEKDYSNLIEQQNFELGNMSYDKVNKEWLNQVRSDIAVAKTNLSGIGIEISESQQTISLLEKDVQEIENQINVANIFGINVVRGNPSNSDKLKGHLTYQKAALNLEKSRLKYLAGLQDLSEKVLQLYDVRYSKIDNILKSQTILQLKEKKARSKINYAKQQKIWSGKLDTLYASLIDLEKQKPLNRAEHANVLNEIFYANEKISYMYLQLLVSRYKDQIKQLKLTISRSSSITLLNKVSDQTLVLSKQFSRVKSLLHDRVDMINERQALLASQKISSQHFSAELKELEGQYNKSIKVVKDLQEEVVTFKTTVEKSLQQELSARQGLLAFTTKAWLDLGDELLLLPNLIYQAFINLTQVVAKSIYHADMYLWLVFAVLETLWVTSVFFTRGYISRMLMSIPDHELGHISIKWVSSNLLHRVILDIAFVLNAYGFLWFFGIPIHIFTFLLDLGWVWVLFKSVLTLARLILVETVHDKDGHDVRLFHRLKITILVGGMITACTVFLHHLPLVYEIKDLFYRLFLVFLAMVSVLLLRSWDVLPALILHHIDDHKTYLRTSIRMLGFLLPLTCLINSVIGVFGFLNLVLTVSWYQGIFLMVLVGYLITRGVLSDLMEYFSRVFIKHVSNGWLWTEAFLKPFDKVVKITLFFGSWAFLFYLYGWDTSSPVVQNIITISNYQIIDILDTSITITSIIEIFIIVSVLYWAARWTREFMYRFLLSKTKDLGLRNSIAILSQYSMIVIGSLIALKVLGIDLRALTVVFGAFAFGIGLGLRDLANNFVCGFLLLFERPIRVGDIVTLGGKDGEVMHIGGRAVTIRTFDHVEMLVPNAEIFSKSFINWTAKDHIIRTIVNMKVDKSYSPLAVQNIIKQTVSENKEVLKEPALAVYLKELEGKYLEFEIRYYVNLRQVGSKTRVQSELLMSIWQNLDDAGVKSYTPLCDVHQNNEIPVLT